MIKIKIAEMLGKHKMSRKDLAEAVGIREATVGLLYKEEIKRIDVEWLDKICAYFQCNLTDIIDYYPDDMIVESNTYTFNQNLKTLESTELKELVINEDTNDTIAQESTEHTTSRPRLVFKQDYLDGKE